MIQLESIQKLIELCVGDIRHTDGSIIFDLPVEESAFEFAHTCAQNDMILSSYRVIHKNKEMDKSFVPWDSLPTPMKDGSIIKFSVTLNLKLLRQQGVSIFYDEKELVELSPEAPSRFIIVQLGVNGNKCTICPDQYNRNEILRYFQVRNIWALLSQHADHVNGRELIFLYKQKISITLEYTIDDLGFEFDGLARLEKVFYDNLHPEAKNNILQNTLYSFLWRVPKANAFKKLLSDFSLFTLSFEENYRAFSVGFSFDKIRKEYTERFREYLSKLNGIMYDTLTRALAIPVTGLIGFIAMKGGFNATSWVINISALILTLFSTASIHYLVCSQFNIVNITRSEYKELFKAIREELETLELAELRKKESQLDNQSAITFRVLRCVYAISLCNLIASGVMFIITTI
ncbi:MAG: hypothetical protein E6017_07500 [Kluyvera cryocrescens]|uniref:hypothetical protein n=1 Tax=Kluyvera cryocrescens TaxID=580 RepID=UPI000D84B32E|nr:hypothetical protein [Kluyvera cryocrescens]MDU5685437.1 hypothetical protein [Kluyvera cryocrescens]SQC35922.1 Uncharacterised protein [Kluyvera cryocrescens]